MALQTQPDFIPQPFAANGDKNEISTTSTTNGLASWVEGFNTINSMPLAAGGVAPSRLDFNGMFNVLSQFAMYAQQGGVFTWDEGQDYSTNALIAHGDVLYQCLAENGPNTDNGEQEPSASSTYWIEIVTDVKPYVVGQWIGLRNSEPPAGFYVRNGALIENASTTVPKLWAYLQQEANTEQCITQAEWTAMQAATYTLTDDDETEVPIWDGVGGVPYYVLDTEADTLRLPDTRGMYSEDAGFDGLTVGGAHGDMIRNITAQHEHLRGDGASGAFFNDTTGGSSAALIDYYNRKLRMDISRVVPTGNSNKPKAFGMLGCIYAG